MPDIKKDYDYSLLSNPLKSSGALSYAKPLFEYGITIDTHFTETPEGELGIPLDFEMPVNYEVKTKLNNLAYVKTHGADVGYKNVTVRAITPDLANNGKIESTFLSPIDFPETGDDPDHYDGYMLDYPFLPSHNYDYKRGLLKHQNTINSQGVKVRETDNEYEFSEEGLTITGLSLSLDLLHQCPYAYLYKFDDYLYYLNNDPEDHSGILYCDGQGFPASHIRMLPMREAKGWAKLTRSEITEYFDSFSRISNTTEYTYNAINKKIHSKNVSTSNPNEREVSEFLYPPDLTDQPYMNELIAANRIVEPVEVRKFLRQGGTDRLLHTTRAQYALFGNSRNNKYLPKFIHTHKGGAAPINTGDMDTRIVYHDYDNYGNPKDVSKKNGPRTAYIWGYNNHYPVAKIEKASYAQATNPALGLNFNIINNPSSPQDLQSEIIKIRNGLPQAMVTIFTYFPLVGTESITDPKGETTWYIYDDFSRLEKTKDTNGELLTEMSYHYRPNP